jgi:hypothetical protein
MSLTPTAEQQAIIDAFRTGDNLVIEAGAGTGKTSTLKLLAAEAPRQRGVYIAYNRAIASDAQRSFPAWVTCKTAHSFAYGAVGKHYSHRLNGPRLPAQRTAQILGLREPVKVGEVVLSPHQLARLVGETLSRFCYGAAEQVRRSHVPAVNGLDRPGQAELAGYLVPVAQRAWDQDITQGSGELRFTHDHYLKMWTLSRPQLPADYVLLDEAQDSNGCVAGLVEDQQAQRIWVGDRSQAIYGWRGALDAMEHAQGRRLQLSQSFRFGPAIATEANKWLTILDAPLRLVGYDQLASRVERLEQPDAVLCRTNAGAIIQAIAATGAGRRPALVGGGQDIRRMAEAAEQLQQGRGTSHPELFAFTSWSEVRAYVEQEAEGSDLRVLVRLIDQHGPRQLMRIVDSLADERYADLVLSTAHKAKGREWPRVRINGDFQEPKPGEDGEPGEPGRDEAMLAYVAVTRAKQVLDRTGLAWIDSLVRPERRLAAAAEAAPVVDSEVVPLEVEPVAAAAVVGYLDGQTRQALAGVPPSPLCPGCGTHGTVVPETALCVTCTTEHVWAEVAAVREQLGLAEQAVLEPAGFVGWAPATDGEAVWFHHSTPAAAAAPVLAVPHCHRCGSDACLCDPDRAAEHSARCGVPAGPRPAREAWARAQLAGAR